MQTTVCLSPYNKAVNGSYNQEADIVLFACDTTNLAFTVQIPDIKTWYGKRFVFKNIPNSISITNTVTLQCANNNTIDLATTLILPAFYSVELISDNKSKALIIGYNR